jgi:hypothetical protein
VFEVPSLGELLYNLSRPYVLNLAKQEEERVREPPRKKRKLSPSPECVAGPSRSSSAGSKAGLDVPASDAPDGDVPKRMLSFILYHPGL